MFLVGLFEMLDLPPRARDPAQFAVDEHGDLICVSISLNSVFNVWLTGRQQGRMRRFAGSATGARGFSGTSPHPPAQPHRLW